MQTVRVDQLAEVLAQAVRDGMRLEQERIIKLLEEQIEAHEYYAAIELIKGEK